tara:strand:- start:2435 stop:4255 length:1821 start_codon:yes stop_codon:yes gene_type:complete
MIVKNILNQMINQDRSIKRLIVLINDGLINIVIFTIISFFLKGTVSYEVSFFVFQFTIILLFIFFRIYDNVIKHIGASYIYRLLIALFIPHFCYFLYLQIFFNNLNDELVILFNFFVTFSLIVISRIVAKSILYQSPHRTENIAIYVDKNHSSAIIDNINHLNQYATIAIIIDDEESRGLYINGVEVYNTSDIQDLIVEKKLSKLFIASQKNIIKLKNTILDELSNAPLKIIEIPDIEDVIKGKYSFDSLEDLSLEDIVDRKTDNLDFLDNTNTFIEGKDVLITGAGGSIGSILSSQIISYNPKSIILLDHSESSLFFTEQKLKQINSNIEIITKLIDLSDKTLLDGMFSTYNIDMVYHAAAYKHVNMLENNILSGVKNNIIGLYYLLNECEKNNVSNFVLISTDKAVKPTTIMGMTKKFCELMMFNFKSNKNCTYSAVRFGNVFNSSGSVIPIFKKQILNQDFLTVTNKDVTRYFMSIDEAVHLVIKASLISKGNEMFILDMGEPRKILDIAKKMIHISGKTIRSKDNPNGDIEIKIIGLGDSEKLHEELSEFSCEKTVEEKVLKSKDSDIEFNNVDEKIKLLLEYIDRKDANKINDYLKNHCFK